MQIDVSTFMPLQTNSFTVSFNNKLKHCSNRCTIIGKSNIWSTSNFLDCEFKDTKKKKYLCEDYILNNENTVTLSTYTTSNYDDW